MGFMLKWDETVLYLAAHIDKHVESLFFGVAAGIQRDVAGVAEIGDLAVMVVSAPIHIHIVLAQKSGNLAGLFHSIVGRVFLRAILPKHVGMREHHNMTIALFGLDTEQVAQPFYLRSAQCAFRRIETDKQVQGVVGMRVARVEPIDRSMEITAKLCPLIEIDVVVAGGDEERISVIYSGFQKKRPIGVGVVALRVDKVAEVYCQRTERVGLVGENEVLQMVVRGVDMRVGADIDAIVFRDRKVHFARRVIVFHRLAKACCHLWTATIEHTCQIVVGITATEQEEREKTEDNLFHSRQNV